MVEMRMMDRMTSTQLRPKRSRMLSLFCLDLSPRMSSTMKVDPRMDSMLLNFGIRASAVLCACVNVGMADGMDDGMDDRHGSDTGVADGHGSGDVIFQSVFSVVYRIGGLVPSITGIYREMREFD